MTYWAGRGSRPTSRTRTFRVRLTDVTSQPSKTFSLEYLAAQVTYTP